MFCELGQCRLLCPKQGGSLRSHSVFLPLFSGLAAQKGAEIRKSPEFLEERVHQCAVPWKKEFVAYFSSPDSQCHTGRRLTLVLTEVYACSFSGCTLLSSWEHSHTYCVNLNDFVSGLNWSKFKNYKRQDKNKCSQKETLKMHYVSSLAPLMDLNP